MLAITMMYRVTLAESPREFRLFTRKTDGNDEACDPLRGIKDRLRTLRSVRVPTNEQRMFAVTFVAVSHVYNAATIQQTF